MTITDSPTIRSGLARVHRQVIDSLLAEGHQVFPCGWFTYDLPTLSAIQQKKIKAPAIFYESPHGKVRVLNVPKRDDNKMLPMTAIWDAMQLFKPDIVLTIGDHWEFWYMQAIRQQCDYSVKWVSYLTVEYEGVPKKWKNLLRSADLLISPSKFGKDVLNSVVPGMDVAFVPYITEPCFQKFDPAERTKLRAARGLSDEIRFMTVGQNTIRKNIPTLLQAVAILKKRRPKDRSKFYVHTNYGACDPQEAYIFDLDDIVERLGVAEWIQFPDHTVSILDKPDDHVMVDEYNASDFYISTALYEGYGFPIVESMACGIPSILNNTSTAPEHVGGKEQGWADRGYLMENKIEIHPPAKFINVLRPDLIANAIEAAIDLHEKDQEKLSKMSAGCELYAKGLTPDLMKTNMSMALAGLSKRTVSLPVEVLGT